MDVPAFEILHFGVEMKSSLTAEREEYNVLTTLQRDVPVLVLDKTIAAQRTRSMRRWAGLTPPYCSPLQRLCRFLQSDHVADELVIMVQRSDWYFRTSLKKCRKTDACEARQALRMAPIA